MENRYLIYRWDQIQPQGSQNPLPMIYIKPDISLLKFAQNQGYNLTVRIIETDSIYDGKVISGVFDSLVLGPNCILPEFQNKEFHTISLNSYFYAYPPKKGYIEIIGMENTEIPAVDVVKMNNIQTRQDIYSGDKNVREGFSGGPEGNEGFGRYEGYTENSNELPIHKGASIFSISILLILIILISIFLFYIFKRKNWL